MNCIIYPEICECKYVRMIVDYVIRGNISRWKLHFLLIYPIVLLIEWRDFACNYNWDWIIIGW